MLTNISGHGGTGAFEAKTAFQFIGQECEIEGLAVGQDVRQEAMSLVGPIWAVVASRSSGLDMLLIREPLVAQFIEAALFDHQPFGGGISIQQAAVKGREDLLDKQQRSALG